MGGVRFFIYPQDHAPLHVHARYAQTLAVVELRADRTVALASRQNRIIPRNAKHGDVRKILRTAVKHYDAIVAAWEKMR